MYYQRTAKTAEQEGAQRQQRLQGELTEAEAALPPAVAAVKAEAQEIEIELRMELAQQVRFLVYLCT